MAVRSLLLAISAALFGCASQSPIATIPVEIVNGNAVASAQIGDEQIDVIVDTGGLDGIGISSEDLKRLDVVFTGESIVRTDAAGDTFESRAFVVPKLSIGGHSFLNVSGFERISSPDGFAGGSPINVLGRALLHEYTVIVDYPNREFRLFAPEQATAVCGSLTSELIENEDDFLVLPIETDGGEMLALMDTGATYSFLQSRLVAARGLQTTDDFYTTSALRVAGRDLGPLEMVVLPIDGAPEIDAFIGANFFSTQKVCFDYGGRRVSFLD